MRLICGPMGAKSDIISPRSEAHAWARMRMRRRWSTVVRGVSEWIESLNWAFIHYEWAVMPSVPVCNSNLSLKWKKGERVKTEKDRGSLRDHLAKRDEGYEVWATERNAFYVYTCLFKPTLFFFLHCWAAGLVVPAFSLFLTSFSVLLALLAALLLGWHCRPLCLQGISRW